MNYEAHPAAMLFPMLSESELRQLADDIAANGQLDPIVIYEDKILDGRNRYAACGLCGIPPRFEFVENIQSPVRFAWSKNGERRHLTTSQKSTVAADMVPMLAEEAKKRQLATQNNNAGRAVVLNSDQQEKGRAHEIAARLVGIGHDSVAKALAVKKSDPETFEKIKRGEITVNAAYQGKKEQPRIGGKQRDKSKPYEVRTERQQQFAEGQKSRMVDGLSMVSGVCHGLANLDVYKAVAACTDEEVSVWAEKAVQHSRDLKQFAVRLREAMRNGKSA